MEIFLQVTAETDLFVSSTMTKSLVRSRERFWKDFCKPVVHKNLLSMQQMLECFLSKIFPQATCISQPCERINY